MSMEMSPIGKNNAVGTMSFGLIWTNGQASLSRVCTQHFTVLVHQHVLCLVCAMGYQPYMSPVLDGEVIVPSVLILVCFFHLA